MAIHLFVPMHLDADLSHIISDRVHSLSLRRKNEPKQTPKAMAHCTIRREVKTWMSEKFVPATEPLQATGIYLFPLRLPVSGGCSEG
jgi:hypothetical protein